VADAHYDPDPHRHPGLHVIAVFEAAKGLAAVLIAAGLGWLGPAALHRGIDDLAVRLHLNPSRGPLASLLRGINPESVHVASTVVAAYALMRLAEGWGLWRAKVWASWLGCIGSAIYLPFEVYALATHAGWLEAAVLAINAIVVWVLARDLLERRR